MEPELSFGSDVLLKSSAPDIVPVLSDAHCVSGTLWEPSSLVATGSLLQSWQLQECFHKVWSALQNAVVLLLCSSSFFLSDLLFRFQLLPCCLSCSSSISHLQCSLFRPRGYIPPSTYLFCREPQVPNTSVPETHSVLLLTLRGCRVRCGFDKLGGL